MQFEGKFCKIGQSREEIKKLILTTKKNCIKVTFS
jgi:hypothetical protein